MGTLGFYWQDSREPLHELQLVQWKEGGSVIEKVTWWDEDEDTKDICAAKNEKTGGTLFGVSKRGRVACLISTLTSPPWFGNGPTPAESLPVTFLKGNMSPEEFAETLKRDKNLYLGLAFYLIVADIPSKSMVYISKKSQSEEIFETEVVGSGFHHVAYRNGLDDPTLPLREIQTLLHIIANKNTGDILEDYRTEFARFDQEAVCGLIEVHIEATGKIDFWDLSILDAESEIEFNHIEFDMVGDESDESV